MSNEQKVLRAYLYSDTEPSQEQTERLEACLERTYGAVGGLYAGNASNVYHDLYYSGCFGDPDYYENGPDPYKNDFSFYVYTSTFHMVDNNHGDVEGVGVQPDIEVLYNRSKLDQGTDTQLDRAIRFIRVGH